MLVAFVLGEVLDEAAGQIQSLGLPLGSILVGVAGIEDGGIDAGQRGRNLEAFSACFGQAFLELHPTKYAEELVKKMQKSGAKAYLVNTGWNGTGKRISIKDTRGIIDAILPPPTGYKKIGVGSVMPRSVPASFAVKPDRK